MTTSQFITIKFLLIFFKIDKEPAVPRGFFSSIYFILTLNLSPDPKYFIISRTFFHRNKENFYSIEHAVPGSIHPYIFFSFEKLVIFFKKAGYELIFHNKYNLNIFSHDTVNENSFFHRDLVFKRL